MPVETCQKYTATLSEILALTPVVQTIADATDVPGVRLEWMNGAWYGNCGFPSAAQHSALLAANAYNSLAAGGVTCTISGVQYTWQGAAGGGWAAAQQGKFSSFANLPSSANDGDIAYIPQLVGSELIRMRYVASIGAWVVEPGQAIINAYNIFEVVSAPSTTFIIYSFPLENGLFQPGQTWRIDAIASGAIGATGAGFRTSVGGNGTNSAKTQITSAIPRARSNKTFSRRPNGTMDFFEFDSANHMATFDAAFSATTPPQVTFEPGQAGDSFLLRTYVLRRIG